MDFYLRFGILISQILFSAGWRMILISLMPVYFDPPECVVITDLSPVAAGGIANVSPIFRAEFRLTADDRLCGSLNPAKRDFVSVSFRKQNTSSYL